MQIRFRKQKKINLLSDQPSACCEMEPGRVQKASQLTLGFEGKISAIEGLMLSRQQLIEKECRLKKQGIFKYEELLIQFFFLSILSLFLLSNFKIQNQFCMSCLAIKTKIMPLRWNPEKDLQSTAHTDKNLPKKDQKLYLSPPQSNSFIKLVSSNIVKRNNSELQKKDLPAKQFSHNQLGSQNNSTANNEELTRREIDFGNISTPKKQKFGSNETTGIADLANGNTAQTYYLINSSPKEVFQQSEVIVRINTQTVKMIPTKLTYEDKQQQEVKETKSKNENFLFDFVLIRKNNSYCGLIIDNRGFLFSLIQAKESFTVDYVKEDGVLKIYHRRKAPEGNFYFCEPFQYSLNELLEMECLNQEKIRIVCKNLQRGVDALCREGYPFFQIQGIENNIYYVHGKFKLLPIYKKGRMIAKEKFSVVMENVREYLLKLCWH